MKDLSSAFSVPVSPSINVPAYRIEGEHRTGLGLTGWPTSELSFYEVGSNQSIRRYSATLRVLDGGLVYRKLISPNSPKGFADGEMQRVEAKGRVLIPVWHRFDGATCGTLGDHEHCSAATPGHDPAKVPHPASSCCLFDEDFPISVHFHVPVGDPIVPALGENIEVTITRY